MQTKHSFPKEKIKILLLENIHPNAVQVFNQSGYFSIETCSKALPEAELIAKIKDVRMIGIRSKTHLRRSVLEAAEKLQAIGCFCIGTNQVDLNYATERGMVVFNSPYSNTRSVAELVIAEIVFLLRGIAPKNMAAHKGEWRKETSGSVEVRGKTLGIVGYGHIGSQVSVLAEAMGMRVVYYDIMPKLPIGNAQSFDKLEDLLAVSDAVSLHVPSTPQTRYMIKATQLAQMKKGAILLNLSRGNVVDIEALRDALQSKHLRGAAVDVFPAEPKGKDDPFVSPLQGLDNVILTPHIGGSTEEAQANIGLDVAQKMANYFDTGNTVGSHTVPEIHLPIQHHTHRILHLHYCTQGMLSKINATISSAGVDIVGEFLATNDKIGYMVTDVRQEVTAELKKALNDIPNTIRTRVLY